MLEAVRGAVIEASLTVRRYFYARDFDVTDKGGNDPLTSADLACNDILKRRLHRIGPEAGWLSEESTDSPERLQASECWIVDPIDGTREFVEGLPQFAVSVGLSREGQAVLGWVALPGEDCIIYGGAGSGVRMARYAVPESLPDGQADYAPEILSDEPCTLSKCQDLWQARLLISRSEEKRGAFQHADNLQVEASGSIARKIALVAAGRGDLSVSLYPKNEWDICGGLALMGGHPSGRYFDLRERKPHRFNSARTKTFGLVAGPSELTRAFADYFDESGKLTLAKKYS